MAKIKSKEQYALEFFKENPKVKTLWANPEGEFFTDINYANNSLKKDEDGKLETLEIFTNETAAETVKEIVNEKAIVPVNPIVPEVINTLKPVKTLEGNDPAHTALLFDKNDAKTTIVGNDKKAKTTSVKKSKQPEVIENKTSLDVVIGSETGKPDVSEN